MLKQSRGTCKVAAKAWVASGCGRKADVCICRPLRTRRTNDGRSARFPASKTRTFSIVWPSASKRGREVVEHPGGSIKQWINQGVFLMCGLANVRAEFSLTALAYNLRRVLNLVGFAELMAAVAA